MKTSNKIDRYNDDLSIEWTQQDNQYLTATTKMPFLNAGDWAISFFARGTGMFFDFRNPSNTDRSIACKWGLGNDGIVLQTGIGSVSHTFGTFPLSQKNNWNHIVLCYDSLTNTVTNYVNSIDLGSTVSPYNYDNINDLVLGRANWTSTIFDDRYLGAMRDMVFTNNVISKEDVLYIYNYGILPTSSHSSVQHYYPLNDKPYESLGSYFLKDVALNYNASSTPSDLELIGFSDKEILVNNEYTSESVYRDFKTRGKDYVLNALKMQRWSNQDSNFGYFKWAYNAHPVPPNFSLGYTWNMLGVFKLLTNTRINPYFDIGRGIILGIEDDFIEYKDGGLIIFTLNLDTSQIRDITITADPIGENKLYLNNELVATVNTPYVQPSTNLVFGVTGSGRYFKSFNGFQAYDRVLTDSEILDGNWSDLSPVVEYGNNISSTNKLIEHTGLGVDATSTGHVFDISDMQINNLYYTGLNMLSSQSITFNGLTLGDKLVVNYDENGITKQEIITVNTVNYTYSNPNSIKLRLATVIKDGFYANEKVYKTIFNNGILRSGILSSYSEVVSAESNFYYPIDNGGSLEFEDLSVNGIQIVANGWLNLMDLQNSIN